MIHNFALIIGAMKCGTTSLFSYLAQHPQISACSAKEPCFFSRKDNWSKGFEWYQDLWGWDSTKHKIALEASSSYTRVPTYLNAAENISSVNANFKFIYIVRNPIDRIESHYTHGHALGFPETKEPLFKGLNNDLITTSLYARQIEEYYQRFPADSILLLKFEDLRNNPLNLLREVCRFLDVDVNYEFQELGTRHNANEGRIGYDPLWRSLRRIKQLRSVARLMPTQHKQMLHSLFGRKIEGNFKLSSEQRSFVLGELQEDLQRLSFQYGIDVSCWGIEI